MAKLHSQVLAEHKTSLLYYAPLTPGLFHFNSQLWNRLLRRACLR